MKRSLDLVLTVLGALVLVPVALLVAVAIWGSFGRPILFRQTRAGRGGTPFTIVKFRTMRPRQYAGQPDGPRTSALGDFLRNHSLDEIPQLWNVLRGEMSLVGPRPTLPEQVEHYTSRQLGRLRARPGLTGWAQVRGRNALSWPERIELDLWYIANQSLLLDLRIIGATALRLVRPEGVTAAGGENPGFPHVLSGPVTAPVRIVRHTVKPETSR